MPTLNVRLDDDERIMLAEQARRSKRSLNGQIQWLIRQESACVLLDERPTLVSSPDLAP